MNHHSCLGKREGQESTDREEWNETFGDPSEYNQEEACCDCQVEDAYGKHQPMACNGEWPRQETILCDAPA
jgi:hypothetical protein